MVVPMQINNNKKMIYGGTTIRKKTSRSGETLRLDD